MLSIQQISFPARNPISHLFSSKKNLWILIFYSKSAKDDFYLLSRTHLLVVLCIILLLFFLSFCNRWKFSSKISGSHSNFLIITTKSVIIAISHSNKNANIGKIVFSCIKNVVSPWIRNRLVPTIFHIFVLKTWNFRSSTLYIGTVPNPPSQTEFQKWMDYTVNMKQRLDGKYINNL